jgi:flagellar biosynthesis/type III secretory pathway M-ring protein FliF/YscJ
VAEKAKSSAYYQSPLTKLFARQQPKVKAKKRVSALLLNFAENDHKRIAELIKQWMQVEQ